MLVDPSNRLVADTLEQEWNDKAAQICPTRENKGSVASSREVSYSTMRSMTGPSQRQRTSKHSGVTHRWRIESESGC